MHLYSVHVGDWKFFVFINGGFYDESEATKRSRFCVEEKDVSYRRDFLERRNVVEDILMHTSESTFEPKSQTLNTIYTKYN